MNRLFTQKALLILALFFVIIGLGVSNWFQLKKIEELTKTVNEIKENSEEAANNELILHGEITELKNSIDNLDSKLDDISNK
jgi:predicted PurR-regulated permease PerM